MPQYRIKIDVEAPSPEKVQMVGNLLQHAVNTVEQENLIRLLEKVRQNPGIVKKALMFI